MRAGAAPFAATMSAATALEKLRQNGCRSWPVVARADVSKRVGIVVRRDLLSVYGVTGVEKISPA
jgi:hypothetical protein